MIAQLQLPSFNRSTRSSGARKLTDNFYWFSQHAVLRQVHRRLTTLYYRLQEQSGPHPHPSAVRLTSLRSSFAGELVLLLVPPDGHCGLQL